MLRYKTIIPLVFIIFLYPESIFGGNIINSDQINYIPDTTFVLDTVTIDAYQIKSKLLTIPGSISTLNVNSINLPDNTNFANLINTLPGVTMQSGTYNTSRIVIRGMGSRTPYNTNRIRAYLNDIPLTSSDGVSTPEEIDLSGIGRIEIIKGPASALYGSGLGGSIHLYTPLETDNKIKALLQYGSFNTIKTNLKGSKQKGNANFQANISHLQSDGYRENSNYKRTTLLSSAIWEHKQWSVNPLILIIAVNGEIPSSLGKTMFETQPQLAAPSWKAIGGYEKYVKAIGGITLKNNLTDQLVNRLTVFGRWNNGFEKRPFNDLDDLSQSIGFRNKLSLHTDKTDWIFGAECIWEQYSWKTQKDGNIVADNLEKRNHLNVFGMVYCRPTAKLNISVATAFNYSNYKLNDHYILDGNQSESRNFPVVFSPRLGINYSFNENIVVYSSAGHGFSLPSPEETLLPEGNVNKNIKPEQGFQMETGTRISLLKKKIYMEGTIYWIELNNLLVTKRYSEDIFMGINAGKTRHLGIELQLQNNIIQNKRFPGNIGSVLSYAQSINRFIEFTSDSMSYDGKKLPGIPKQTLQLQVNWDPIVHLTINFHVLYNGMQYLNDINSEQYPGYWLGNTRIMYAINLKKQKLLEFSAGINNITNVRYASMLVVNAIGFGFAEPRYYYPGLPRNLYLRVGLSL
jgi:iron complex outermembrane receptor protein